MKYQIIVCLSVFFATCLHVNGQQKPSKHKRPEKIDADFIFDSTGKLIGFPTTVIRRKDNICAKVIVPFSYINDQVKTFKNRLRRTYDSLNTTENTRNYGCYFPGSLFSDYMASLKNHIEFFDDANNWLAIISPGANQLKTIKHQYIPAAEFIDNLFNKHFSLKVSSGSQQLLYKNLAMAFDPQDSCFLFTFCEDLAKLICDNCGNERPAKLDFDLIRSDPFNQTLRDWFVMTNDSLGSIETKYGLRSNLISMASTTSITGLQYPFIHFSIADGLRSWFPYWFWFTDGKLTLDPFRTISSDTVDRLKENIPRYVKELARLNQEKSFLDSVLKKVRHKIDKVEQFREVQDSLDVVIRNIAAITKLKKNDEDIIFARGAGYNPVSSYALNKAPLYISYADITRPQHQMDASQKYRLVKNKKRQIHRVVEVPDDENPVLVLYNIDSSLALQFKQAPAEFVDEEEFTEIISEQLKAIDITGLTTQEITASQNFFESFIKKGVPVQHGLNKATDCFSNEFDNPIHKQIKKIADNYAAKKITVYYEKNIFTDDIPNSSRYYTLSEKDIHKSKSPYKDSVNIIKKGDTEQKILGQTYIKVGRLRFVQIAAGIALTRRPATVVNIDTTAQGFRTTTSDNSARAIVGFKVYPFQHYTRDRSIIPRYPHRRISIFGGFEMIRPFNNLYLGGCYDLVPGLTISAGNNWNLQKTFKVENNTITDTYRTYKSTGVYYAVTVNPKLFVQFVKLIFKSI